ncbi:hypothetical protein BJ508DRAFT_416301 [Ascobolus immersus RN42]|uniref:Nuclear pore complex protein An-Nup82 n=1 Tax=Ascobolus immersus RN42 TaxID=1160509 RepID=A0A3N4I4E5_ASCIM|nr:hypothetical protein BJ508DRAFT_416301 [Ascobolus immersus RN42]
MVKVISESVPWLRPSTPGAELFTFTPTERSDPNRLHPQSGPQTAAPKRLVVSKDSKVYSARGTTIRRADLQHLKALEGIAQQNSYIKAVKTFDLPGLNFEIRQLEISEDGAWLAVVGETRVGVVLLPSTQLDQKDLDRVKPKYWELGATIHSNSSSRIVRAVWHPLAVETASLVVLTADGYLRCYDIHPPNPLSFAQPDQTLDLHKLAGRQRTTAGFSPDDVDYEPASCTFSDLLDFWGPFTFYVVMRGGDVYGICPLVPSKWSPPTDHFVEELTVDAKSRLDDINQGIVNEQEKLHLRQRIKWLSDLHSQQKAAAINPQPFDEDRGVVFTRPKNIDSKPLLQGPFLVKPEPVYTGEAFACDIFHAYTEATTLLGICYDTGRIDIMIEPSPLQPRFATRPSQRRRGYGLTDEDELEMTLPALSLHECIQIRTPNREANWPVFVDDKMDAHTLIVANESGVIVCDMSKWLEALKKLDDSEVDDYQILPELERLPGSEVTRVTPKNIRNIVGTTAVSNPYAGYLMLVAAEDAFMAVELEYPGLAPKELIEGMEESHAFATQASQLLPPAPHVKPTPFQISPALSQPSALNRLQQALAQRPQFHQPFQYDTGSLKILQDASVQLEREFTQLKPVIEDIYSRATMQHESFRFQVQQAIELHNQIERLQKMDIRERLRNAIKKQDELQARADKLLKLIVLHGGPGLSDAERSWISEVDKLDHKINGPGGMQAKVDRAKEIKTQIIEQVESEKEDLGEVLKGMKVNPDFKQGSIAVLLDMLTKEGELVDTTKKKIEDIADQLRALEV